MKNMLIDFYNDKRTTWLANFCEYFNLDFKGFMSEIYNEEGIKSTSEKIDRYIKIK